MTQPPEQIRSIITRLTTALPDVIAIYRFGSFGTEHERADSDIDIAVLGGRIFDPIELWELSQEMAAALRHDVDLIDLAAASTVFKARILSEGERLYCADQAYCDSYEAYAFSSYARLNEERRGILQDVLARGSVHGR